MSKVQLALIQTEQYWHNPEQNRNHFGALMQGLNDVDLIVLPEMFSTGFTMASSDMAEPMTGPTMSWLKSQAAELNTHICGSMIVEDGGKFYNRFFLIDALGSVLTYDKRHLFRMADEHRHYSAGVGKLIFDVKGARFCAQVCYDLRFPVFSRNHDDYDVLLYVANWPAARREHWRTLLTARAIENQSFVVGLNRVGTDGNDIAYSGDSGVIDGNGNWVKDLQETNGVTKVVIDLKPLKQYRDQFPAWRDADGFTLDER